MITINRGDLIGYLDTSWRLLFLGMVSYRASAGQTQYDNTALLFVDQDGVSAIIGIDQVDANDIWILEKYDSDLFRLLVEENITRNFLDLPVSCVEWRLPEAVMQYECLVDLKTRVTITGFEESFTYYGLTE